MQKRFRIWQNFRCTQLYTNTRSSTTWRIADQTRTFFCVFLQACAIPVHVTPFENEMKASLRCIPALKLWTSSARCWIRPRQLKKPVIGAAESCASWSMLVRWPNAGDDLAFKANQNWNFMSSISFECKMEFRKLFVGSPGNEDSITTTAKVPQAVQAVFLFFLFFFYFLYHFRCLFCFVFLPKSWPTSKWDQETWSFLYPSRSFAQ